MPMLYCLDLLFKRLYCYIIEAEKQVRSLLNAPFSGISFLAAINYSHFFLRCTKNRPP